VGARYTRYADDLAFSGGDDFARRAYRFQSFVAAIAIDCGFRINLRKTRIMGCAMRQELAGVVVNSHPNLRRADYDRLKAIVYNCVRYGHKSQNRDAQCDLRAHLEGRLAWLGQLNPTRAARLRALMGRIDWST
jgi:hypothetical protein